eukprot:1152151-Pelagomonas_calceolata.AAC.1
MGRIGKGYIAVPAYKGSLAEAKKLPENKVAGKSHKLRWRLTFSQVVWLLSLLNCSKFTKYIHEIGNNTISLIGLLLQEMKNTLRASLRIVESA